jgi:hypothetical protein
VLSTRHQAIFLAPLPGRKKISVRGVSHAQPFTLLLFCFILFCLHRFIKNTKKISSFIVAFTCLLFSLARMSNPEVEVRTFKQQGGRVSNMLGTELEMLIIGVQKIILP